MYPSAPLNSTLTLWLDISMQFFKRIFKNEHLQNHVEGCTKCGKLIFTYDDYFNEYKCENCGRTACDKPLGSVEIIEKINAPSTDDNPEIENDFCDNIFTIANRILAVYEMRGLMTL